MFSNKRHPIITAVLVTALLGSGCGGGSGGGSANGAPTVSIDFPNAAIPRSEHSRITLKVIATDPDGDTLTYSWARIAGPEIAIENGKTAEVTFTAPEVTGENVSLELEVTVNDGHQHAVKARQTVIITKAPGLAFVASVRGDDINEVFFNRIGAAGPVKLHAELVASGPVNVRDFTKLPGGRVAYRMNKDGSDTYRAYVATVDGSGEHEITGDLAPGGSVEQLLVSPNGKHVALWGDLAIDDVNELFIVPAASTDGQDRVKVSGEITASDENPDNGEIDGAVSSGFVWSPTSTHIAFAGDLRTNRFHEVYVAPVDGTTRHVLSDTLRDADTCSEPLADCSIWMMYWSPNGTHVAFISALRTLNNELYVATLDGTDQRSISHGETLPNTENRIDAFAIFDPWTSGNAPLVVSREDGLYIARLDETEPREILDVFVDAIYWSPDHRRAAISDDETGLYVLDFRKPEPELTKIKDDRATNIVWSADSNRLAYSDYATEGEETKDAHIANFASENTPLTVAVEGTVDDLAWSPSGMQVSLTVYGEESTAIIFVSADNGSLTTVQELSSDASVATTWSPTNDQLAVGVIDGQNLSMSLAGANGILRTVFEGDNANLDEDIAWSPDGQQLVFVVEQQQGDGSYETLYAAPAIEPGETVRISHEPADVSGDGIPGNRIGKFFWFTGTQTGD